jgi:hypothetical protein
LVGLPGFEPGDIGSSGFVWVLTGLFSVQPEREISLCFTLCGRLVITGYHGKIAGQGKELMPRPALA